MDDPTFEKIRDLVKKEKTKIHTHVHETEREVTEALAQSNVRPVARYFQVES